MSSASGVDSYEVMKRSKNWHHDIKRIDGESVEAVVRRFQDSSDGPGKDCLLGKIIENYAIFRPGWANAFAQYLDNDPEAGALMHDEIIWRSASNFDQAKTQKGEGKAFNAYLVSALLNSLKNFHNTRMSHKNHPRVNCPVCSEEVYQIDAKHLRHRIDFDRYKKMFANYPIASLDGEVALPGAGEGARPVGAPCASWSEFRRDFQAKQYPVYNPYLEQYVTEITPGMLRAVGTTVRGHLERFATISIGKYYMDMTTCPFTGKRTHSITPEYLEKIGKTTLDFLHAVCKYPLRRWQVKCALCGKWADNIWDHLALKEHNYAQAMTQEEFERAYGSGRTKLHITTNCFVEGDSGDSTHIADLLASDGGQDDTIDIEDSLLEVARDEVDRRIARAVRVALTVEDVLYASAEKAIVRLPSDLQNTQTKAVKSAIKSALTLDDFDIWPVDAVTKAPKLGDREVAVMIPGRDSLKSRLLRMIEESDLSKG